MGSSVRAGKNFSANNASGKRIKSDFYETPYSLTGLFLRNYSVASEASILEPACGNGAITRVLHEFGYDDVTSYDIVSGTDFLDEDKKYDFIITNPPYSLAGAFIKHALLLCPEFAFLLPLSYLHGKSRFDNFYVQGILKHVFVFTRYPLLGDQLREDGCHRTGMMVYAWFVFDSAGGRVPTIQWLDNNEYVLRNGR